ncbi:hypothetical protein G5C65_00830 [Streptomyces sp. SB3404]|uniref:Lipoprotein n=2 Tax=Streptomyces boncukensis TaxID=2711219 RepID=A0A6G4WR11_9ACTN|nr:hypothetical protein [Streptomyces boncukensis]
MAGLTACGSDGDGGSSGGSSKAGGSSSEGGKKDGDSPVRSALTALQAASKTTQKQESAKVEGDQKQTARGASMRSRSEGSFEWAGSGMTGTAEITTEGSAAGAAGGRPMQARYLKDAMYTQLPAGPYEGKWVKYDYDVLAQKGGASGAYLKDQIQNNNPARSVQLLLATGKVKAVGKESVRGVQATHYTGVVELGELTRSQSQELSESDLKALEQQFRQLGLTKERIDLWIDDKDLLIKKREVARSSTGSTDVDNTVYYSDYGTPVNVSAPAGAMNFEDMAGAGAAAGQS